MIDLETPRRFLGLVAQAHELAENVLRPISRRYDRGEHERPVELDMLAAAIDGMNAAMEGTGASGVRRASGGNGENRNGTNLSTVLSIVDMCWGDVGLMLALPRQGLGNSAIAAVATEDQLARYGGRWAAMAITEPEARPAASAIPTPA